MTLVSDVRFAVRALRRRPAFSALAVLVLALGIGANTLMFSVVDAVLLRSLPYADAGSLVVLFADGRARGQSNRLPATPGDFLDWREQADVFVDLCALRNESRRITSVEIPVVPLVHAVTADYFDVLGVKPLLGRGFVPGEDEPGRDDIVVLSYGIWQSVFGGEPDIVGRSISLDGRAHGVVGVMGREFHSAHMFPVQPGLWVPTSIAALRQDRSTRDLLVYGRLGPGRSLAAAQAVMTELATRLAGQYPETNDRWDVALVPLRDHAVGSFSPIGGRLLAAVGLVLLIACANVANLILVRAAERSREIALRAALGASRFRIACQSLTESLLLSLVGGVLGAALAYAGAGPLTRLIPTQASVPFLDRVGIDGRILTFTFVLSLVSGVLFGLGPARYATRHDLVQALREGGRGLVRAPGRRLRESLVVFEVALAVVIAVAAGLMLRTFAGLQGVHPGFDADRILKLRTSLRGEEFRSPSSRIAHFEELKERLESLPAVSIASAVSREPPLLGPRGGGAGVLGAVRLSLPDQPGDVTVSAVFNVVMPDYFETLGIPILQGRGVSRQDTAEGRRVAAISQSMAQRYFEGVDPLGRTFAVNGPRPQPVEIVGVVGDVVMAGTDPSPQPVFYVPYSQNPLTSMSMVMRVPEGDPAGSARDAERIAWSLSLATNVYYVETLERRIADFNWRTRFGAMALGFFAALALLLGVAGIYAVISYTVLQRRNELGVRMALGARAKDILALVLGSGLRLVLVGLAAGTVVSLIVTRLLAGFLYGVSPGDATNLGAVSFILLVAATGACLGPALTASRLDPQTALRE